MSIWYQCKVKAIAADKTAVAKFFGLNDSFEDVRTDTFEFSFGGKNAPSLTLRKIVEQNPDLIFLAEQSIECDTVEQFVTRFDKIKNEQQFFWIQDFGSVTNKVSKKLLEEYDKEHPTLVLKHLNAEKGYENFRWEMLFWDFNKAADRLNRAKEYEEMVNPWKHFNVKTYIIEYEYNHGSKDEPSFHPDHQGPAPMGEINAIQEKFARYVKEGKLDEGDVRNVKIREVESR